VKINMPYSLDGRTVEAEIVELAPHMAFATWAVHRSPLNPERWRVANIETGAFINSSDSATKAEALAKAREALSKRSPQFVLAKMHKERKRLEMYGALE
jgi:hypothetical protein